MKTLETDIIMICKGWYNKEKYKNELEAMNAYYHREYGNEDITMDKRFVIELFLKPAYIKYGNIRNLLEPSISEDMSMEFHEILYRRMVSGIFHIMLKSYQEFDEYDSMIEYAKNCNYTDNTIGII